MATYLWGLEDSGKRLIVPAADLNFLMHDDDSGRCQMFQVGVPELCIINWAAENFKDTTKTFIDCGAHMGAYSVLLAKYFKNVVSFEAQQRTYFQLCGNLFINEIENVQPYHRAVTDPVKAHQIATLSIVSEDGGGSTLLTPQKEQKILKTEKVKTTTIDHYRLDNVGLIKLDIEGNELKALHGAKNTLERSDFPPIIFEANNDAWYAEQKESLFKYLNSLNYEIGEIRPFENMYVAVSQKHLQE